MARPPAAEPNADWLARAADEVEKRVLARKGAGATVVCASGISPSGPVHLGNLRELMTTHLVAEELRGRGWTVDHLHSWDDFDRLRKVPAGVPASFREHIGRPIGEIPDPFGEFETYADRFMAPFVDAVGRLGAPVRFIRQSKIYRANRYRDGIRAALAARFAIFDELSKYQAEGRQDRPLEERRAAYWPFKVYCVSCGKDDSELLSWDEATDDIDYRCPHCGPAKTNLSRECIGKLVWKVDWPMRWAFEQVDFEPGGEDHSTPGGSLTVGRELVRIVYGGEAPNYLGYGFVGMEGRTKISSSAGTSATPELALRFLEPALLRWMYVRRPPATAFTINFGQEIWRAYDEWDALGEKVAAGEASPLDLATHRRASRTSTGPLPAPARPVSFRLLASASDLTQGNRAQVLRIVAWHLGMEEAPAELEGELQPRLDLAMGWVENCLPEDERLHVRASFDAETWAGFEETTHRGLRMLVELMGEDYTLDGLTRVVYGVPKRLLGLDFEAAPTPELKKLQRQFFIAIYRLVLGAETGPRLPTLFLSLGRERMARLLVPAEG